MNSNKATAVGLGVGIGLGLPVAGLMIGLYYYRFVRPRKGLSAQASANSATKADFGVAMTNNPVHQNF